LPTKHGFRLSLSGLSRFQLFVYIHTFCGQHLVNQENLKRYFDALVDSEAFLAEDLTHDPAMIVRDEVVVRPNTTADIEGTDDSTPEGRLATKALIQDLANEHSSLRTTDRYSHTHQEPEYRRLAASKVGLNFVVRPNGPKIGERVAQ